MKFVRITKNAVKLRCENNESWRDTFAFSLDIIPQKPIPRNVVILSARGARRWSMTWRRFLKQQCVGDVVIIKKIEFESSARQCRNTA